MTQEEEKRLDQATDGQLAFVIKAMLLTNRIHFADIERALCIAENTGI